MAENGGDCVVPCCCCDDTTWQVAHQRLASVSPLSASAAPAVALTTDVKSRDKAIWRITFLARRYRFQASLLIEESIETVGIWTELVKVLSGSTSSEFVLTTALLTTHYAEPLQVPHQCRVAFSENLRID